MEVTLKQRKQFVRNEQVIPKEDIQVYQYALAFSLLSVPDQIDSRNVSIYEHDYIHQIYTKSNKSYPHLVMLHGFGGTSLTYVRLFKSLAQYYQVHAIDTFGVGYSSLGHFQHNFTHQQAISYYIEAIQEWRKALGIDSMEMVGHSFGGYLGACYAKRYPNRVIRLILLSPAGFHVRSNHSLTSPQKIWSYLSEIVYNQNIKPTTIMRNYFLGSRFMERLLGGRMKLEGQQKQVWKKYFWNVANRGDSSQGGFYKIFEWPLRPQETIFEMIKAHKIALHVEVYFGGKMDWVYSQSEIDKIVDQFAQNHITYGTIAAAGHQMIFDCPYQVIDLIVSGRVHT